jgi:ABC-type multidrug transport system ATPase subunit
MCGLLQDDLLYESLTVWETLWFAAQLRLPRTMSKAAKRDRVNAVLAALGLTRCRDTIIGDQIDSSTQDVDA